jgi:hypothetical protein
MAIIRDGSGQDFAAKVDQTLNLHTRSVSESQQNEAGLNGDSYILNTGLLTFTSANESALTILTNNENRPIIITQAVISTGTSTGGTEPFGIFQIYRNPTAMVGGTGNPIITTNLNFGSANFLSVDSEMGQEGATLTGGAVLGGFTLPLGGVGNIPSSIFLPRGASIGVTFTPPPSNTSVIAGFRVDAHLLPVL